jgi:hypothetical protein
MVEVLLNGEANFSFIARLFASLFFFLLKSEHRAMVAALRFADEILLVALEFCEKWLKRAGGWLLTRSLRAGVERWTPASASSLCSEERTKRALGHW